MTNPDEGSSSTVQYYRFMRYYLTNIRNFPPRECSGVIRNQQRMVQKGEVSLAEIHVALKHYEAATKQMDARKRMHIRSFFSKLVIKEWQQPLGAPRSLRPAHTDSAIGVLAKLDALRHDAEPASAPVAPVKQTPILEHEL